MAIAPVPRHSTGPQKGARGGPGPRRIALLAPRGMCSDHNRAQHRTRGRALVTPHELAHRRRAIDAHTTEGSRPASPGIDNRKDVMLSPLINVEWARRELQKFLLAARVVQKETGVFPTGPQPSRQPLFSHRLTSSSR